MRLDKYLKVSRLIKRRVVAKDVSNSERILVNDRIAKASTEVKIGDTIAIQFGNKIVTVRVTSIEASIHKEDALGMYEVISEK